MFGIATSCSFLFQCSCLVLQLSVAVTVPEPRPEEFHSSPFFCGLNKKETTMNCCLIASPKYDSLNVGAAEIWNVFHAT